MRSTPVLLIVLLVLAGLPRVWLLGHTTVTARDSIGFIRYAWQLGRHPWKEVLRRHTNPPGYPLAVAAASVPVNRWAGGTEAFRMQLSAQLVSALAGTLLVIPMFFLGRALWDTRVGFWSAVLFQCLPAATRATSDALAEGLFLLLLASALTLGVRGLQKRSAVRYGWCGLFSALAYLTRPEGALAAAAVFLVLVGGQMVPSWRRPRRKVLAGTAALMLGFLLPAAPYAAVIGGLTNKPTAIRLLGGDWPEQMEVRAPAASLRDETSPEVVVRGRTDFQSVLLDRTDWKSVLRKQLPGCDTKNPWESEAGCPATGPGPLLAVSPGLMWQDRLDLHGGHLAWGLWALASELIRSFQYVAWLPAVAGWWAHRRRLWALPGAWVLVLAFSFHALAVWGVGSLRGYVSDRHTLPLVLLVTFSVAAGVPVMAGWLSDRLRNWDSRPARLPGVIEIALLLALMALGLPDVFKPLHANRAGHRSAGLWLAGHTHPADPILDPFCWAHYHAGRVFLEEASPPAPPGYRPRHYVVVERSGNEHGRLPLLPEAVRCAAHGTLVYRCPLHEQKGRDEEVLVYRLND